MDYLGKPLVIDKANIESRSVLKISLALSIALLHV